MNAAHIELATLDTDSKLSGYVPVNRAVLTLYEAIEILQAEPSARVRVCITIEKQPQPVDIRHEIVAKVLRDSYSISDPTSVARTIVEKLDEQAAAKP